jgi:hypothetical protein
MRVEGTFYQADRTNFLLEKRRFNELVDVDRGRSHKAGL